jgi:hypothetical protein
VICTTMFVLMRYSALKELSPWGLALLREEANLMRNSQHLPHHLLVLCHVNIYHLHPIVSSTSKTDVCWSF